MNSKNAGCKLTEIVVTMSTTSKSLAQASAPVNTNIGRGNTGTHNIGNNNPGNNNVGNGNTGNNNIGNHNAGNGFIGNNCGGSGVFNCVKNGQVVRG
ncbi:MAG: hypothetical protein WA667_23780 [Candidatus Nitrosopolaris sp.]